MYKPQGYTSLSPYLLVEDAEPLLTFIRHVFGAEPIFVHETQGRHIEVRIDDTILMIGEMPGARAEAHLHVYVPDVDTSFEVALSAGARAVQDPTEKGDGDRRCGVTGPSGITWWLSTALEPRSAA